MAAVLRILAWTLVIGVISFSIGFFGPMILAPGANQGPLLGIFITGPLGVMAGFIIGVVRELIGARKSPREVWRSGLGERLRPSPSTIRSAAALGGALLALYGAGALRRGEGRGAAAAIVLGIAIVYYGVTGRAPAWFRR